MRMWHYSAFVFTCLAAQSAQAICPADKPLTRPDSRYEEVASSNGTEVRDTITNLVWRRCMEGAEWNGTACVGEPTAMTWPEAQEVARVAPATSLEGGAVWRLPDDSELFSLIDFACYAPTINSAWFSATKFERNWSSTTNERYGDFAEVVWFTTGAQYFKNKDESAFVRLVRSD